MTEPPAPPATTVADHSLAGGVEINGYRIVRVLGAGGFGITYLAEHVVMQDQVAIKEFLPVTVARRAADGVSVRPVTAGDNETFAWGLDRFAQEAKTLARLRGHPNIVPVLTYFPAHGTGYLVMEFVRGRSLRQILREEAPLPEPRVRAVVDGVLAALETIHAAEFLHRDIKPDNVIVRPDGTPVLIDFGSARQVLGQRTKAATEIVSPGYSPYEQYDSDGDHGAWTDLYALGATLYECVSGRRPAESPGRIGARYRQKPDPVAPAAAVGAGRYAPGLLAAIDAALGVIESERPRSVADFRAVLAGVTTPVPAAAGATIMVEPGDRTLTAGDSPGSPTLMPGAGAPAVAAPGPGGAGAMRSRRGLVGAVVGALALAGVGAVALTRFGGPSADDTRKSEEAARRKAEEESRAKAEEAARKAKEAEESKRKAEEEAKAEEAARKAKEEEEAKRKAEEQEKAKAAEEARKRAEEARRRQQEEERRRSDEEARRRAAEEEARRKAEEERRAREAACPAGQRRPDGSCPEGKR